MTAIRPSKKSIEPITIIIVAAKTIHPAMGRAWESLYAAVVAAISTSLGLRRGPARAGPHILCFSPVGGKAPNGPAKLGQAKRGTAEKDNSRREADPRRISEARELQICVGAPVKVDEPADDEDSGRGSK